MIEILGQTPVKMSFFSATDLTWTDLAPNPGLFGDKPGDEQPVSWHGY